MRKRGAVASRVGRWRIHVSNDRRLTPLWSALSTGSRGGRRQRGLGMMPVFAVVPARLGVEAAETRRCKSGRMTSATSQPGRLSVLRRGGDAYVSSPAHRNILPGRSMSVSSVRGGVSARARVIPTLYTMDAGRVTDGDHAARGGAGLAGVRRCRRGT